LTSPSAYMVKHWPAILPDWTLRPQSIAICLLRSQIPLNLDHDPQRQEKDRLLQLFMAWGNHLLQQTLPLSHQLAVISPQDGKPLFSPPGDKPVDLVATVHQCLGLPYVRTPGGCKTLIHSQWQAAIYPGVVMTTMSLAEASLFFHLDPV
jgi:hypothetical protein